MSDDTLIPPSRLADLSMLDPAGEWAMIVRTLGGGGSKATIPQTLLVNCVRLADAAVAEYELARFAIKAFHEKRPEQFGLGYVLRASAHLENCLWNLERFLKHAKALRSREDAEPELKALIPPSLNFLRQDAERQITRLRHTISHLEKDAQDGLLPAGTSIALMAIESGIRVGTHSISWSDLQGWLQEAHACAKKLAEFRPTPPPT